MNKVIFSQQSIFHLYRLGILVTGVTGKRYKLENQQELFSLIRYCSRASDLTIKRQFEAFLYVTDEVTKQTMAKMKLIEYTGGIGEHSQVA